MSLIRIFLSPTVLDVCNHWDMYHVGGHRTLIQDIGDARMCVSFAGMCGCVVWDLGGRHSYDKDLYRYYCLQTIVLQHHLKIGFCTCWLID